MADFDFGDITDTHVHLWNPLTTPRGGAQAAKYYRLAPRVFEAAFPLMVPKANRLFIRTPRYVGRPFLLEDYAAHAAGDLTVPASPIKEARLGVGNFIHVEANWVGSGFAAVDETHWVWAMCRDRTPRVAGLIVRADPRDPEISDILDAHVDACPVVVGVRCSAAHHPSTSIRNWIDESHAYTSKAFMSGFEAIAERGLTFDAWVYGHQLDDVSALAREFPETPIVLDHYGTPVGLIGPVGDVPEADARTVGLWRDRLCRLAELPNVVIKHSGLGLPVLGYPAPLGRSQFVELTAPHVADVTRIFGARRVMFGSNTPMDSCIADFQSIVTAVATGVKEAVGIGGLEQAFRENARRIYRLAEEP